MGEDMRLAESGEQAGTNTKTKEKYRWIGSAAVKIAVFFVLIISAVAAAASAVVCYINADMGLYNGEAKQAIIRAFNRYSCEYADTVYGYLNQGDKEAAQAFMKDTNAEIQLLLEKDAYPVNESKVIWQTGDTEANWLFSLCGIYQFEGAEDEVLNLNGSILHENTDYVFRVCYDPEFPVKDGVWETYLRVMKCYELRFAVIGIMAGSVLLCLGCFVFLMCSAGHRRGRGEIVPSVLNGMHFDVLTVGWCILIGLTLTVAFSIRTGRVLWDLIGMALLLVPSGILAVLYLMEFAVRLKLGKWWRNTLIYVILRGLWRGVRILCGGLWRLFCGIPLVMTTLIVFLGVCIVEFIGVLFFVEAEGALLWLLEKAVLLPFVLYIALTCKKLQAASEAMAEGAEDYVVDTSHMFGVFKQHGENLNSLSQGITKAVAERMKSEHLKTELITNVSHDLKTPLTSIINYADLICEEKPENSRIAEYAEVLLRQSGRLKKLLEDLVEASKATTGNLEVNLEPCEISVLLSQAVGEYQQKMEEKGLELHAGQPEQGLRIMADGRHLWRIFDNLLNNICKYAQENSRVYLSVAQRENKVQIIFRNMSKYALGISAEELEERFVRGDKSRHMEGNGLGLSIAKSLTELQKGRMDIVIDGDLFKVILEFELLQ